MESLEKAAVKGETEMKTNCAWYLLNNSGPGRPGSHARRSGGVGATSAIVLAPVIEKIQRVGRFLPAATRLTFSMKRMKRRPGH